MASIDAVRALERAELLSAAPESQMPQSVVTLDTSVGAAVGGDSAAEVALPPEFREPMALITKLRAFVGACDQSSCGRSVGACLLGVVCVCAWSGVYLCDRGCGAKALARAQVLTHAWCGVHSRARCRVQATARC